MRRLIFISMLAWTIAGCASGLKIKRISDTPIDPSSKEIVFLTSTEWDNDFRIELAKFGFKPKKSAAVGTIKEGTTVSDGSIQKERATFTNIATGRYGLSLHSRKVVNWCIFDRNIVEADFDLEISDLQTNEVIMVIRKGGWTESCAYRGLTTIFEELAEEMDKIWTDSSAPRSPAGI